MPTAEASAAGAAVKSVTEDASSTTLEPLLPAETQQQIAARCGQMMHGAVSSLCVYLGHELGLYKTLKSLGLATALSFLLRAGEQCIGMYICRRPSMAWLVYW
jgi:hypothetical protein